MSEDDYEEEGYEDTEGGDDDFEYEEFDDVE